MNIAFVGCGFVFDIYMRTRWAHPELHISGIFDIDEERGQIVGTHYDLHVYPDYDTLLADTAVEVVVNLTNIASHYEVTKRALEAGKHVYSEKPLTTEVDQSMELFEVAASRNLVLSAAPCNLFSDTVRTLWKGVEDGAVGKPVLVYAELDDSPAHLMNLEGVRSPTGAPFPYVEEFQQGCTFEHVGYHLVWICAMFGPARSVTAYSNRLVPKKTSAPLSPPDTPDFSVACLNLASGVTARITNSVVAPRDQRMRIIGEEGELWAESYSHYRSPVRLERFSSASLAARKFYSVRTNPLLGRTFGVGGRRLPLVTHWKSHAIGSEKGARRSLKQRLLAWIRRREVYAQDKLLGVAEMAYAIEQGLPQPLPADFLTHINELTLLIQGAGPSGFTGAPTTTFARIPRAPSSSKLSANYGAFCRPSLIDRTLGELVKSAQKGR